MSEKYFVITYMSSLKYKPILKFTSNLKEGCGLQFSTNSKITISF